MNKLSLLLLAALLASAGVPSARAYDGEEEAEPAPAGTAAAPNEDAPEPPASSRRPPRQGYTAPVLRSNSNYRAQAAAPAPAPAQEDEPEEEAEPVERPSRPARTLQSVSAPAAPAAAAPSGGSGGSCPPVPKKVRTFSKKSVESYCKGGACAESVELRHAKYPSVVQVGEIADFMERCDFRNDTPCPVPGGYQDASGLGNNSVYMGVPPGGTAGPGTPQTLVPIVGFSPRYRSYDLSIPFEIDPRMRGRNLMMTYSVNSNNNSGMHVSISECEGDFSRRAVLLQEGDLLNYTVVVSQGKEGSARTRSDTTRTLVALKPGKRYFLNVRRVLKAGLETPTDGLSDAEIHPYVVARQISRDGMLSQEFPRLSWMALPAGAPGSLDESGVAAKPGFRAPGQGL